MDPSVGKRALAVKTINSAEYVLVWWEFIIRFFLYVGRKEGNGLFNDALNTFYLRLYGVRHRVKDH